MTLKLLKMVFTLSIMPVFVSLYAKSESVDWNTPCKTAPIKAQFGSSAEWISEQGVQFQGVTSPEKQPWPKLLNEQHFSIILGKDSFVPSGIRAAEMDFTIYVGVADGEPPRTVGCYGDKIFMYALRLERPSGEIITQLQERYGTIKQTVKVKTPVQGVEVEHILFTNTSQSIVFLARHLIDGAPGKSTYVLYYRPDAFQMLKKAFVGEEQTDLATYEGTIHHITEKGSKLWSTKCSTPGAVEKLFSPVVKLTPHSDRSWGFVTDAKHVFMKTSTAVDASYGLELEKRSVAYLGTDDSNYFFVRVLCYNAALAKIEVMWPKALPIPATSIKSMSDRLFGTPVRSDHSGNAINEKSRQVHMYEKDGFTVFLENESGRLVFYSPEFMKKWPKITADIDRERQAKRQKETDAIR